MEPEEETWQTYPAVALPVIGRGQVPKCDHCKREGTSETLKRCGGCATMLYCSRECQKAAWPAHKQMCRGWQDEPRSDMGPSPLNNAKIVMEWLNIHVETFKILLNSTVQLSGGVAHALSGQRGIICILSVRKNWNGNPAAPFRFLSFKLTHRDDADMLGGQWDDLMASCKKSEEGFKLAENPAMAGIIPIIFVVRENDGFVVNNYFPVFHTRSRDNAPLPARTRVALRAMVMHCQRCLDSGLAYAETEDSSDEDMIVNIGRYVRKGKKWKWVVHRRDDPELKEMWAHTIAMTGGMTMPQTWAIYNDLMGI